MLTIEPPLRGQDQWGAGHFGASRGSRTHRGVDFAAAPGGDVELEFTDTEKVFDPEDVYGDAPNPTQL